MMPGNDEIAALREQVEQLRQQVGMLQDVNEIRHLQYKYGYYLDKCLYNEVVDLFADDGEVHFLGGIFRGRDSVRRLYLGRFGENFTGGSNRPVHGFLLDHPQLQAIIDVDPDRRTARARARSLLQAGRHESMQVDSTAPRQWWEGGVYENEYVKDNGIWKFRVLNYRAFWHADFDKGWAYTRPGYVPLFSETYPDNPLGPDALIEPRPELWPHTDLVPFHYPHPVTGEWVK